MYHYRIFPLFGIALLVSVFAFAQRKAKQEFYQLETYHFSTPAQEALIDNYLQTAYLPALHRQKIKAVGVFKPIANDTAANKVVYVLIPVKNWKWVLELSNAISKDPEYISGGSAFLDAPYNAPAYRRKEVALLKAFSYAPTLQLPTLTSPRADRIYELRSYESHTDNRFKNKVQMFNEGGEVSLFKRLGFNAIFYGEVLAGAKMPNLMYITSFNNMDDRNAHWKTFSADPEWKTLSSKPEYQNNVSKGEVILTRAAAYSDY